MGDLEWFGRSVGNVRNCGRSVGIDEDDGSRAGVFRRGLRGSREPSLGVVEIDGNDGSQAGVTRSPGLSEPNPRSGRN